MPESLVVPRNSLNKHFALIAATLDGQVDSSAQIEVIADWNVVPLVAGLVGDGCEIIARNRGPDVPVAPILLIKNGLWAWVGYREEWDSEPPAGRVQLFSFRSAGLTFYFGYRNNRYKPQMFRAEWTGWARWNGSEYGYQAGDAAHPHWQFDALDSLKRDDASQRAADYLSVLKIEEQDVKPRDFSPQSMDSEDVSDLISTQELSRIHFASAAAWWKDVPNNSHVHNPASLTELQIWVKKTLRFVGQELARLQRRQSAS